MISLARALLLLLLPLLAKISSSSPIPPTISFTPYYEFSLMQREIDACKRVTSARARDGNAYDRDTNPYRIRYAVYNFALDWEDLWTTVIEARNSGVVVQVMVDDGQLGPNREYNKGLQALRDAGFVYEPTQIGLTAAEQLNAELIGVNVTGIMHLKMRGFEYIDNDVGGDGSVVRELMTGSFNPELAAETGVPMPNNDTLVSFVMSPSDVAYQKLWSSYDAKYNSVLGAYTIENSYTAGDEYNVVFSPDSGVQAVDLVIDSVDRTDTAVLISVFTLRDVKSRNRGNRTLYEALVDAKKRGATVVVATDTNMVEKGEHKFTSDLRDAGIDVYWCENDVGKFHAMHNKNAVFGLGSESRVVTGSCNWSGSAMGSSYHEVPINTEDTLWIEGDSVGSLFRSNFLGVLRSYEAQQIEGVRAVEEIVKELGEIEGWRSVEIEFEIACAGEERLSELQVTDAAGSVVATLQLTQDNVFAGALDSPVPFGTQLRLNYGEGEVDLVADVYFPPRDSRVTVAEKGEGKGGVMMMKVVDSLN